MIHLTQRAAQVLRLIARRELSRSQVAADLGVAVNTASVYLQALRGYGLASSNNRGRSSTWSASADGLRLIASKARVSAKKGGR